MLQQKRFIAWIQLMPNENPHYPEGGSVVVASSNSKVYLNQIKRQSKFNDRIIVSDTKKKEATK